MNRVKRPKGLTLLLYGLPKSTNSPRSPGIESFYLVARHLSISGPAAP